MDRYERKQERERKKEELLKKFAIKKLMRKANVPKNAPQEIIDYYIISYVAKLKHDFSSVVLSDEQRSNPDFLIKLYNANSEIIGYQKPKATDIALTSNVDFMLEYVKLAYAYKQKKNPLMDYNQVGLELLVSEFDNTLENPEFIIKLHKNFKWANIVGILHNSFLQPNVLKSKEDIDKNKARYLSVLERIPKDIVISQARRFGYKIVRDIPIDLYYYNEIVEAGVEFDGFRSLRQVDITRVLENKECIIKAFQKDGFEELEKYLRWTLSPIRSHYYVDRHIIDENETYDLRYQHVQQELKKFKELIEIIKHEQDLVHCEGEPVKAIEQSHGVDYVYQEFDDLNRCEEDIEKMFRKKREDKQKKEDDELKAKVDEIIKKYEEPQA